MAWAQIHDGAMTHPKVIGLSDKGFRLWVWGLSYAQQHLTDGLLIAEAIPSQLRRASSELVSKSLWEPCDRGFLVHDYLAWNDSRETVYKKRADAKERMANARTRSREVRANSSSEHSENISRSSTGWGVRTTGSKKEESEIGDRAASFIARYPVIYAKARSGASFVVREARDFDAFLDLVTREKDDTRLDKLFELFLRMKGKDVLNEPGTPRQFAHVFPTCDRILRENNQ